MIVDFGPLSHDLASLGYVVLGIMCSCIGIDSDDGGDVNILFDCLLTLIILFLCFSYPSYLCSLSLR